ncbi:MAG: GNAT family N-acetyltransferase [Erysipelotrichaceae bacterium]|nr:GNAT family N-acetyltransferase [Erysipelotrichaceae bacterium]
MIFNKLFRRRIVGNVVDLAVSYVDKGNKFNDNIASVYYDIYVHNTNVKVGRCDLRIGMNIELYYAGNIGYHIYEEYRGNSYAYYASLILLKLAKEEYGMSELLITCSPDNIPSFKTCVRLKGKLVETVMVPTNHYLYMKNETEKHIFKYKL